MNRRLAEGSGCRAIRIIDPRLSKLALLAPLFVNVSQVHGLREVFPCGAERRKEHGRDAEFLEQALPPPPMQALRLPFRKVVCTPTHARAPKRTAPEAYPAPSYLSWPGLTRPSIYQAAPWMAGSEAGHGEESGVLPLNIIPGEWRW